MNKEFDIHPIQATILTELLFVQRARFSELNKKRLGTDLFSFHLKQLLNLGLATKNDNFYSLTTKGKEFANRFDTDKVEVEKQAKVAVLIVCVGKINNKTCYLIQQRLKQPSYGHWGFVTGKLKWGETLEEGVKRELSEETGLTGKLKLVGIKHKMDYPQIGDILEDKYFFVHKVTVVKGKLKSEFEGGRNVWMTKEEILGLPDLFDGVEESMDMTTSKRLRVVETKYRVRGY